MRNRWRIKSKFLPLESEKKKMEKENVLVSTPAAEADDGWWERQWLKLRWIRAVKKIIWTATNGKTNKQMSQCYDANCQGRREKTAKTPTKQQNICLSLRCILSGNTRQRWEKTSAACQRWHEGLSGGESEREEGTISTRKAKRSMFFFVFFLNTNYKSTAFLFVPTHGHNYLWLELAVKPGRVLAR